LTRISKRTLITSVLDRFGLIDVVLRLRACLRVPWLTVVNYHRVHGDIATHPFDDEVIDSTPESFERQIAMLARYFTPIQLEDLQHFLAGKPLPQNPALVTFDDGYRDNHDVALPILRKYGVPATFFVATDFITRRKMFWWDRICYLIKHSPKHSIELEYPTRVQLDLRGARAASTRKALRTVIRHYGLDLDRYLDELTAATESEWNADIERKAADEHVMTWDQVRALRASGMDVQSHTQTHRVLQTLPPDRLAAELAGSRDDLSRELGEAPAALSYPVSRSIANEPAIRAAMRAAGYEIGFSAATGITTLSRDLDPLDVRRLAVDRHFDSSYFRGMVAVPYLAYRS
jgi:peptidoglycan/xylan/chitin deacetylase (PgdA/CDA1 family)